MNEPRIWPNSPEEEHRLRQDIAARATQDSSEPDAAKELVKAIRRARHDGVKLVAAHDAALIAKTLAERSLAEVSADEVREAAARLRAFESQFTPAERGPNDKDICTLCAFVAGTFSLRASGTPLSSNLRDRVREVLERHRYKERIQSPCSCGSQPYTSYIKWLGGKGYQEEYLDHIMSLLAALPELSEPLAAESLKPCGCTPDTCDEGICPCASCHGPVAESPGPVKAQAKPEAGAKEGGEL